MKQRSWVSLLCVCCLLIGMCLLTACGSTSGNDSSAVNGDSSIGLEDESSAPKKEQVKFPTKTPSGKFEDNVFCVEFSKYDWTETYMTYAQNAGWCDYVPKVGDKVTISFDYCTTGSSEMRFFNTHSLPSSKPKAQKWTENPDYWFEKLTPQDEQPRKGHYEWTFTATKDDVQDEDGKPRPLRWTWQQIDNSGDDPEFYDFYYWNFKITANGSTVNKVTVDKYQTTNDMGHAVDVAPEKLSPTMNQ